MAELYSIRLYHNTGFDSVNRPSSASVLSNALYTDYESNYLWQNNILTKTRIKASWQQVEDADYCRIGQMYYIITGVEMLNNMTAELSLMLDAFISIGGLGSFDIISGWTERAHVSSANDNLFDNTIEEPWVPTSPLVMDNIEQIGVVEDGQVLNVVQSTVKLEDIQHIAEVYSTEASSTLQGSITIPKIPPAESPTQFRFGFRDAIRSFSYPASTFYDLDYQGIKDAINDVRSLGIDSAIINSYQLPLSQVQGSSLVRGRIVNLTNTINTSASYFAPSDNMLFQYGNVSVNNKKVYAMFNLYTVLSSCSGDRKEYKAEDIYNGQNKPVFLEYADLSPTGKPYIQPQSFHRAATALYQESVSGEEWYRVPIAYTGVSGSRMQNAEFSRESINRWLAASAGAIGGFTAAIANAGEPLKAAQGIGAAVGSIAMAAERQQNAEILRQTGQNIVAPEITFPQNYGAQAYLGNIFFIYRVRLSDNDMVRCDNFFTQYGYAQDKKFEYSDMSNRQYFNYIKTKGANINCEAPLRIRQLVCDLLNSGVRLWHVMPNTSAMTYNP